MADKQSDRAKQDEQDSCYSDVECKGEGSLHDVLGIRKAAGNDLQDDVEDQENPADHEGDSSGADQTENAESAGSWLHSFGQYAWE